MNLFQHHADLIVTHFFVSRSYSLRLFFFEHMRILTCTLAFHTVGGAQSSARTPRLVQDSERKVSSQQWHT